jgi:exodeoxyribonuclease-3
MKIATWNINSVRLRLETVLAFLQQADIDVLCLQETKTQDLHFPAEAFAAAGWPHQAIRGEKSYNGVAIIARQPLAKIDHMEWTGKSDCRHIWAMTNDGIGIHNFYVPAGGDVPDIETNPKFAHKLQFIDEMTSHDKRAEPAYVISTSHCQNHRRGYGAGQCWSSKIIFSEKCDGRSPGTRQPS